MFACKGNRYPQSTCLSPKMCCLQPRNRNLNTATMSSLSISQSITPKQSAYFPRHNALLDSSTPYFVTSFPFLLHTCIAPPCSYFSLLINKALGSFQLHKFRSSSRKSSLCQGVEKINRAHLQPRRSHKKGDFVRLFSFHM